MDMIGQMGYGAEDEEEVRSIVLSVQERIRLGRITLGDAVRLLRNDVLKMNQDDFAKQCKISRRTLSQFELGCGNPTMHTVNSVLEQFGLTLCIGRRGDQHMRHNNDRATKID
ncbi:helix-turn-helix transcriptional regulator [Pseudomonas brassicacearum]|uniref:Helix-turn-helix transcriptional regulator n=3 Tax=Pseudomonas TaxID=286 RepID=A0A6H9S4D7_9PSED|nr:helix-turn-helix transcriptional regulator [Pseudomonas brassicacearum subsp. brassicacearum]KAB0549323.1 helix-turn-helix transcriptional regulator [Pseudomonas palleroniana]NJP59346.1 helix-turn-helix transcriptional regulator [Pseudomonas brassicacearum]SDP24275.1 Helix-turn-helix domain-containing protein [Pseudomonas brassicacearum]